MLRKILKGIIFIGLFIVPFTPLFVSAHFFFPFITTKAFIWRIVVETIFAAWLLLAYLDPSYRPKRTPILTALIAFLVVVGVADLFGVSPLKSFWSNFERMEGYITILHLGAFFLVTSSFFKEREWKWWWNTNLLASLFVVIYGFMQLAGKASIHQGGARVDASFGNAAYLAVYLLVNIFIALFYLLRERETYMRAIYAVVIALQAVILFETATRGAILGILGGLLLMAVLNVTNRHSPRIRTVSLAGITVFVVLVGGFFLVRTTIFVQHNLVLQRFASISSAELKTEGRSFVWPMALKGIAEKPFLGWGQDNFSSVFDEHYSAQMYHLEPWFDRAHNIFLDWGVAGGILGLAAYLSLYVTLLLCIWRRDNSFTRVEKTLFTSLIAGYFFHNLFVFDNLVSYIFFFSFLAYIHSHVVMHREGAKEHHITQAREQLTLYYAVPAAVLLGVVLYFVNIKPMIANADLIKALQYAQSTGSVSPTEAAPYFDEAFNYFQKAYGESYLGRGEVVEWIAQDAPQFLSLVAASADKRTAYFNFAKAAVEKQADENPLDARYQILAGTFLTETAAIDEGRAYLAKAEKLIPEKQVIYFEEGAGYIAQKNYKDAEAVLKKAYDLAPAYQEAQIVYLTGAIYAGDNTTAQMLIAKIPNDVLAMDNRISTALYNTGRYSDLLTLLEERIQDNPKNQQGYIDLAVVLVKMGKRTEAVNVLKQLEQVSPETKSQVDQYIQGIQNGTL